MYKISSTDLFFNTDMLPVAGFVATGPAGFAAANPLKVAALEVERVVGLPKNQSISLIAYQDHLLLMDLLEYF